MNIYAVHLITFSPTHTSKQVGEAIVRGTSISEITKTDLTLRPAFGIGADERHSYFRRSGGAGGRIW